jgi:hypothetical protein
MRVRTSHNTLLFTFIDGWHTMEVLETVLLFIITLGVLVFVHEFGHFITAKLCA